MIVTDATREIPELWTDDLCVELFDHARELGQNGNPGGYMLTRDLFPFVGFEEENGRHLKPLDEWDYEGIRAWIADHPERVALTWQRVVRRPW